MDEKWTRREYRDPKTKKKIIELRLFSGEIIKLEGENIRVEKYDIEIPLKALGLVKEESVEIPLAPLGVVKKSTKEIPVKGL